MSKQHNFTIIEDDYDSEFRYEAPPLPPLATLDEDVVYLGTFSKLLEPGLRLAYVICRNANLAALEKSRSALGPTVALPIQLAVADLLNSGQLDSNAARQLRRYAARRRLVANQLGSAPGVRRISGLEAGLHVTLELESEIDATRIQSELREVGIVVGTLDDCRIEPEPTKPGLIISYAGHDLDTLRDCCVDITSKLMEVESRPDQDS